MYSKLQHGLHRLVHSCVTNWRNYTCTTVFQRQQGYRCPWMDSGSGAVHSRLAPASRQWKCLLFDVRTRHGGRFAWNSRSVDPVWARQAARRSFFVTQDTGQQDGAPGWTDWSRSLQSPTRRLKSAAIHERVLLWADHHGFILPEARNEHRAKHKSCEYVCWKLSNRAAT